MKIEEFETVAEFVQAYNVQYAKFRPAGRSLTADDVNFLVEGLNATAFRSTPFMYSFMAVLHLPQVVGAVYTGYEEVFLTFPAGGVLCGLLLGSVSTRRFADGAETDDERAV